jgi:hypothetical protein
MTNLTSPGKAGQPGDAARGLRGPSSIPIVPLGISMSAFLAVSYLFCILVGILVGGWGWGLHQPWLQFLPGFTWLTWPTFFLGLVESIAYGWYVALLFGGFYNFTAARLGPVR